MACRSCGLCTLGTRVERRTGSVVATRAAAASDRHGNNSGVHFIHMQLAAVRLPLGVHTGSVERARGGGAEREDERRQYAPARHHKLPAPSARARVRHAATPPLRGKRATSGGVERQLCSGSQHFAGIWACGRAASSGRAVQPGLERHCQLRCTRREGERAASGGVERQSVSGSQPFADLSACKRVPSSARGGWAEREGERRQ